MGFTDPTFVTNTIQSLADQPTETASEVKQAFDKAAADIKTYLTALNDELEATTDGNSGMDNIGMTPIDGVMTTPQQSLEFLKARVDATTPTTNVYSVLDNGLTGDGVTNDATVLNALITAIGSKEATIVFPALTTGQATYLIQANVTFPENISIVFLNGATLKVDNTYSVTGTNTNLKAGVYQIFDLSLGGTIDGVWESNIWNPVLFGAIGDGVANDTSSFENILSTSSDNQKITLTKDLTYLITTLSTAKKVIIDANGATLKATALSNVGIIFNYDGEIRNGTYDNIWIGFVSSNVERGYVQGNFINQTYSNITINTLAKNVLIEKCYFTGKAKGAGGTSDFPTLTISKGSKNITYRNNECYDVVAGITADGIDDYIDNIYVVNNKFKTMEQYALKTDVGNNYWFVGNVVEDANHGVFFEAIDAVGAESSRLSGNNLNVINNDFKSLLNALYIAGADNPFASLRFIGNNIDSCTNGINRACGFMTIEQNRFYNGEFFVYCQGIIKPGSMKIIGNTIEKTNSPSVPDTDSDGVSIIASIVISCTTDDGSGDWVNFVEIKDNTFKDFHTRAIMVERSASGYPDIQIEGNYFKAGASSANVAHFGRSSFIEVINNRLKGTVSGDEITFGVVANNALSYGNINENSWQVVSAVPSTGTFLPNTIYKRETPSIGGTSPNEFVYTGWFRVTKGSANVVNTDWVNQQIFTGN